MRVLGDPEKVDKKPGELSKVVRGLRKDNEKLGSEVIADFCDSLDGIIEDLRNEMSVTLAKARAEQAAQEVIRAEKKRLDRRSNKGDAPIADQKVMGGDVVSSDDDSRELVEAGIDSEDESDG